MPERRHVVVVGAGIVGVSTALHAHLRGWDVTLLDPRGIAGGASGGNAGVLALSECVPVGSPGTIRSVPRMLLSRAGPLHIRPAYFPRLLPWLARMLVASTPARVEQLSRALSAILGEALAAHEELAQPAGVRHCIVRSGWLKAFETEQGFESAASDFTLMRRRGVACDELASTGIGELEPALRGRFARAVFHPDCHHVGDPLVYVRALGDHLLAQGVEWRATAVKSFTTNGGRITGVVTESGTIATDAVVLAAGAWSKGLAAQLGCSVPLDTERGYHMMLDASACKVKLQRPLYWADNAVVISPMGDAVRVTSSVEFAGLEAEPDFDLVLRCLPAVRQLLPGAELVPGSMWLGFRPSIPDSLPVIGPVPGLSNAILAFGHGHLGLTLGPVTGKLVGALLDGVRPVISLDPFSPARFGARGARRAPALSPSLHNEHRP
jgi:D-amino-acid dehydrogenase